MAYFVDSSGLVKRYIHEQGSLWVNSWITPAAGNEIIISELAMVEVLSAFTRRRKNGTISPAIHGVIRSDFFAHVANQYSTITLRQSIITKAQVLVEQYELRTLDALQLACAILA